MRKMTPTNILDELMPTTSETSDITAALRWDYDQLGDAAAEVRRHAVEIKRNERRASGAIVEAGQHLIAVKERLDHGQWGDWLTTEFSMTDRTARRMMAVAEQFDGKTDTVSVLGTSVLYLLSGDSVPEPAREAVIDAAKSGERVTKARAKTIIARHKPETLTKNDMSVLTPINIPMPSQYGTVQPKVEIVPADDTPLPDWVTAPDMRVSTASRLITVYRQAIVTENEYGELTGCFADWLTPKRELQKCIDRLERLIALLEGKQTEQPEWLEVDA